MHSTKLLARYARRKMYRTAATACWPTVSALANTTADTSSTPRRAAARCPSPCSAGAACGGVGRLSLLFAFLRLLLCLLGFFQGRGRLFLGLAEARTGTVQRVKMIALIYQQRSALLVPLRIHQGHSLRQGGAA